MPVTPDYIPLATNTVASFNMAAGAGKVALCNSITQLTGTPANTATTNPPALLITTSIVDFLGYGAVNYNERFTLADPAIPATTSLTNSAPTASATTGLIRLANATSTAASMAPGGSDATAGNVL